MRVLTDTHTLVWALSTPEKLSSDARDALGRSTFTASVVNLWELVLKAHKPGALLTDPLSWWNRYVTPSHIPTLAIRTEHIRTLAGLPDIHKDPFDRILVAQALSEQLVLLSCDAGLGGYGISIIW